MPDLIFRSPVERPLHPKSWVRPMGSLEFQVTQRFGDVDAFFHDGRTHGAIDIGNTRCNDPILAMAAGVSHHVHDKATAVGGAQNALGLRIDHGHGVVSEYWHLNAYSVADGAPVAVGDHIGLLGSSGLGGACHCHIELKVNGERIDPEPHMFGAPLALGGPDMALRLSAGQYRPLTNRAFETDVSARLRAEPTTGSGILETYPGGRPVEPSGVVKGEDRPD